MTTPSNWNPYPYQPPRKRPVWPWILIGVVALFFGGCGALIVIGAAVGHHTGKTVTPSAQHAPTMPPSITITTTTKAPPAAVGQEARDGDTVFVVTSVDQSKIAGIPSNQFMQVTAQGVFLNVHMTVTNAGNKPQTFFATNQKLKIHDSVFEANSAAAMWTQAANVPVNPGNSIQVVVSFDVPVGTPPSGTLQLHESIFSAGVQVLLT